MYLKGVTAPFGWTSRWAVPGSLEYLTKVPGMDLCKSNGKNVVFEAGINKVQSGSKLWLGFNVTYLSYIYLFI